MDVITLLHTCVYKCVCFRKYMNMCVCKIPVQKGNKHSVEREKLEQRATRAKQRFENLSLFQKGEKDKSAAVFGRRLRGTFFYWQGLILRGV